LLIQTNDDFPRLRCGSLRAGIVLNARVARTAFLGGETTRSCWWLRASKKDMIHTWDHSANVVGKENQGFKLFPFLHHVHNEIAIFGYAHLSASSVEKPESYFWLVLDTSHYTPWYSITSNYIHQTMCFFIHSHYIGILCYYELLCSFRSFLQLQSLLPK
jgi:hypothetical protein